MPPEQAAAAAPPIAHAIGGALGSALALLLFYPLERARIELQSEASRLQPSSPSSSSSSSLSTTKRSTKDAAMAVSNPELQSNSVHVMEKNYDQSTEATGRTEKPDIVMVPQPTASAPTNTSSHKQDSDDSDTDYEDARDKIVAASDASSWASLPNHTMGDDGIQQQPQPPPSEGTPSWDMESSASSIEDDAVPKTKPEKSNIIAKTSKRSGLIACLLQLHVRRALYQGVTPVVTTIVASQFVFFYLHAFFKRLLTVTTTTTATTTTFSSQLQKTLASHSAMSSLITSCLAGIANVLVTNPLWVCNMAIVTGETRTSHLWEELRTMIRERGIRYLWNGTTASLLLVSNPVIQFFCYEQFKQARLLYHQHSPRPNKNKNNHRYNHSNTPTPFRRSSSSLPSSSSSSSPLLAPTILTPVEAFFIGALAKAIATIATYPLQLTQTVMRLHKEGHTRYRGTWDCLVQLYQSGGMEGLFRGMRAKLVQTVLTAAFTFLTYEQILGIVHKALLTPSSRMATTTGR